MSYYPQPYYQPPSGPMPGYNVPYTSGAPIMGGMPQQGELRIKVVQANMYRDTDWLKQFCLAQQVHRKMDPYVVMEFHGHQFRTRILKNAGKHPIWNEEFTIHVSSMNDEIRLKVMDQDFGPDDVVGVANIKVSSLCFNNGVKDWFTLDYKRKQAGQILLESRFFPTNVPYQGAMFGAAGYQHVPPPMNVQPQPYSSYQMHPPPTSNMQYQQPVGFKDALRNATYNLDQAFGGSSYPPPNYYPQGQPHYY
eukprot:403355426